MYATDGRDAVAILPEIPQPSPGAPEPVVIAREGLARVAYYAPDNINWDNARPEDLGEEEVVVLQFESVRGLMFGAPNDEALHGHPLYERGLKPYAVHAVQESSWVRQLERMNRVHPLHDADGFRQLRHFIVTFHDSTFECVCGAEPVANVVRGTTPEQAATAKP